MNDTDFADHLARVLDACTPPHPPHPSAFLPARPDDEWDGPDDEDALDDDNGWDLTDSADLETGGGPGAADSDGSGDAPVRDFGGAPAATVCAVDCGMATLGSTEHGVVVACRAASTTDDPGGRSCADLARTGPVHLRMSDRGEMLHRMGADLGEPTFYVRVAPDGRPVAKPSVAATPKLLADRLRAYVERLMQAHALGGLPSEAVLLLDGAMTTRSRDTPTAWWASLARTAAERGVSLVAVSKQSDMVIADRPVAFWLEGNGPGYRCLTPRRRAEQPARAARILGNLYAVRWGVGGPALRVDVLPAGGRDDREALEAVAASVSVRGGMPEPLVRAHALTYITRPAFDVLQADAMAAHNLDPAQDEHLGAAVWGFSAGRFK